MTICFFFCQAEDGIRELVRSRGLGDVYKRQVLACQAASARHGEQVRHPLSDQGDEGDNSDDNFGCLLYTSDAADERSSVDLGGRRIIKKKN